MPDSFDVTWSALVTELDLESTRLLDELKTAWRAVDAASQSLDPFAADDSARVEGGDLESLRQLFDDTARTLLSTPLDQLGRVRPVYRVTRALEHHQGALEDIIRRLPATITIAPADVRRVVTSKGGSSWRAAWARLWRTPRPLPLRHAVGRFVRRQLKRSAKQRGRFVLLLAQALLALLDPWQAMRGASLRRIQGLEPDQRALDRTRQQWLRQQTTYRKRAEHVLAGLERQRTRAEAALAGELLRGHRAAGRHSSEETPRLLGYRGYWARLLRASSNQASLERAVVGLGQGAYRVLVDALASLETEHRDVREELERAVQTLETWEQGTGQPLPPPTAHLVSAADRTRAWASALSDLSRKTLPATLESSKPRRPLPGWRSPWKPLEPRALFDAALARATEGDNAALPGLDEVEAAHQAIVRDIERAREVVTFGIETAAEEGDPDLALAREGAGNMLTQLRQRPAVVDVRQLAGRSMVSAVATILYECHVAIDQSRLGFLAHVAREDGYQLGKVVADLARYSGRRVARAQRYQLGRLSRWWLGWIGWEPLPGPEPVQRRGYFGEALGITFAPRDLPMLYRRLFRLEPVEDPRFLVGRDVELSAIAEARTLWESGRAVSIALTGARGSGKTSLINCALVRVLDGIPVVRGTFIDRLRSTEQMQSFIRVLLGLTDDEDPVAALNGHRRIIILEEVERTSLRRVGGTEALAALLALIADTSRSTLWLLSLNLSAFRLLDATVGMGQHFSHRINTMSIKPKHLRAAVLQRHHLSGLRLQFARPPDRSALGARMRTLLGVDENAESAFFRTLHRQSGGVFRAAFELWQRYIDRIEGGVVYMSRPVDLDYTRLGAMLNREDVFALHAVLQHGSLTPEEYAEIHDVSLAQSRQQIESLVDREILEPEPAGPGWRVRPSAGFMVRSALNAENLW